MSIYVETTIRGDLEEVWRRTQTPDLHELWDLRFTSIEYLERPNPEAPQRFRYATRIGFGIEIEGWGETVGEQQKDGVRTSALRFGSDHPLSLIREGSGYWKYEPVDGGVRFLTGYDYKVRWGIVGRVIDWIFRPLMGWATAWSFDRLKGWIESDRDPVTTGRLAAVHALASLAVALVWCWHGLVPKLLGPHPDEVHMMLAAGAPEAIAPAAVRLAGLAELIFGVLVLICARQRWPFLLTLFLMGLATVGVLGTAPEYALGAFGPVTLNLQLAVLALIALIAGRDLPTARACLRSPPERSPTKEET